MISSDITSRSFAQCPVHLKRRVLDQRMASSHQARILLVDDFAPWRDQLRSLLEARTDWRIIGEASDGREAVEKATEMQPDIVLLDVGMPSLNGIEAAKIIQRCPKSK